MHQFDPNLRELDGDVLLQGDVIGVKLTETPTLGGPNHVFDPSEEFTVHVEWEVYGLIEPLWLEALADHWSIAAYAESLGGGKEIRIGETTKAKSAAVACTVNGAMPHCEKWEADITVPANTLEEGNPGGPPDSPSGIYKLAVSVFLNSSLGEPGFDLIGYYEGPVIQAENPR